MYSNILSRRVAIALAAVFFQPQAQADEPDNSEKSLPTKDAEVKELSTITITARKRSEDAQKTPISVSTFSGEGLEQRGITNISEIGPMTPNVSFDAGSAISGSSNTTTVFIRGVGQTDFNLTIDPGVGIYLDGVYISRSVGSLFDTADISQIEVLRGPQGTLFGKNTIGGAILLTSRQPEFDGGPSGAMAFTTGRYDRTDLKANFNLPVDQNFAVQASMNMQKRDGYGESLYDRRRFGNKNDVSGRLAAALKVNENLKFVLAADASYTNENSPPVKILALNPIGLFPLIYNHFSPKAAGCDVDFNASNCYGPQWLTNSRYTNWNSDPDYSNARVLGESLTTDWDLNWALFKSITAYRDMRSSFWLENDGAPMLEINATNKYDDHQFSQEFQLTGDSLDNRLKWVGGLYYLREGGTDRNTVFHGSDIFSFLSGGSIRNISRAAYAQGTYSLTEKFGLTLGVRYSYEEKKFRPDSYIITIIDPLSAFFAAAGIRNFNGDQGPLQAGNRILPYTWGATSKGNFSPAATLDYKFNDEIYAYLTYSEGFKAGGFTQRVFPPLTTIPSFQPEYVKSYEAGLKTKLFDNRLRFNFDVFNMSYTDIQQVVVVSFAPTIQNAGRASSRGFEAEFQAMPWKWLELNGGVGHTDAAYESVPPAAAPVTVNSKLPDTPKWTATLGAAAYVYDNDRYGSMSLRLDANYKSGVYKDAVNTPTLYQPGYIVANVSANFALPRRHLSLSAGIINLTDKRYLVTGYADLAAAGNVYGFYARPREWYARLRYDF